nr:MAG: replication associated protein [Cressdnaviricota sp.]
MDVVDVGLGEGNIKTNRRPPLAHKWLLTLFGFSEEDILKLKSLDVHEYTFQEEICPSTNRPHIQGYFNFKKQVRPMESVDKRGVWLVVKKPAEAEAYCRKLQTSVAERRWCYPERLPEPPKEVINIDESMWMTELLWMLQQVPDRRTIIWVQGPPKTGKTTFIRYLLDRYKKQVLFVSGKGTDIKYAVQKFIETKQDLRIAIFGLPMSHEGHISYDSLESIKDGVLFSPKYESGMVVLPPCHVIVFANHVPDLAKLALDRWKVYEIHSYSAELSLSQFGGGPGLAGPLMLKNI